MQNQRTLTRNFSLQQAKRFLAWRDRQNDLFRQNEKIYGSEETHFKTPSEASSWHRMNGYASENDAFSFCPATDRFEKNGQMLLGKFTGQGHFAAMWP